MCLCSNGLYWSPGPWPALNLSPEAEAASGCCIKDSYFTQHRACARPKSHGSYKEYTVKAKRHFFSLFFCFVWLVGLFWFVGGEGWEMILTCLQALQKFWNKYTFHKHLEDNKSQQQLLHVAARTSSPCGFVKNKLCWTDLISTFSNVTGFRNKGKVAVTNLTITKVFKMVACDILISKPQQRGLEETMIDWVQSWFDNVSERLSVVLCQSGRI